MHIFVNDLLSMRGWEVDFIPSGRVKERVIVKRLIYAIVIFLFIFQVDVIMLSSLN